MIKLGEKHVESYITKSKLPDADYVINPYIGCPHKCIYCYAEFMKRFCNHNEDWGDFLDVKYCNHKIKTDKLIGGSVLFGSVTDAYNPFEKKYEITRRILENFISSDIKIDILTKSDLVLRDIEIFKLIPNIRVGISINTLDDEFRKNIEPFASNIERRIKVLKILHENKIKNYLFMSPIFPGFENFKSIIDLTKDYVNQYCFENLNLRAAYKVRVLKMIKEKYPEKYEMYEEIYLKNNGNYWRNLENEIIEYCEKNNVNYKIYFYHEKIRKK